MKQDKLLLIGKLSGALIHDLNNPLTTILIYAESIYKRSEPASVVNEQSHEILEGARRCRNLIQDFQKFVQRPRAQKNSLLALEDLLRSVHLITKHLMDMTKIRFELDLAPDLKPAFIRSGELEQVLIGLILHVLEHSAEPQSFRVSTRESGDAVLIELTTDQDSFWISDPDLLLYQQMLQQMNAQLDTSSDADKVAQLCIRLSSTSSEA